MAICTFVDFCCMASFMFKTLGKVACWAIGGVAAIIGAVVVGSFAIVAVCRCAARCGWLQAVEAPARARVTCVASFSREG